MILPVSNKVIKAEEPKNESSVELPKQEPEVIKITEPINTITITTPTTVANLSLNVDYK